MRTIHFPSATRPIQHDLSIKPGDTVLSVDDIVSEHANIPVPCALGAVINAQCIPQLKAQLVCGAANNQLATNQKRFNLYKKDIIYAPDYLANAGSIMSACAEYLQKPIDSVQGRFEHIGVRTKKILVLSSQSSEPRYCVADKWQSKTLKVVLRVQLQNYAI